MPHKDDLSPFAVNNQETQRMTINTQVDERALREIYLPAFEKILRSLPKKRSGGKRIMPRAN